MPRYALELNLLLMESLAVINNKSAGSARSKRQAPPRPAIDRAVRGRGAPTSTLDFYLLFQTLLYSLSHLLTVCVLYGAISDTTENIVCIFVIIQCGRSVVLWCKLYSFTTAFARAWHFSTLTVVSTDKMVIEFGITNMNNRLVPQETKVRKRWLCLGFRCGGCGWGGLDWSRRTSLPSSSSSERRSGRGGRGSPSAPSTSSSTASLFAHIRATQSPCRPPPPPPAALHRAASPQP